MTNDQVQFSWHVRLAKSLMQFVRQLAKVWHLTQLLGSRANDCLSRAKSFQQSGCQSRTQAGHQVQCQESLQLGIQSHGSVPESRSFNGPCKQESPSV